jgi:hypothetical protein
LEAIGHGDVAPIIREIALLRAEPSDARSWRAASGDRPSAKDVIMAAIGRPEERRRLAALMRRDAIAADWKSLTILAR